MPEYTESIVRCSEAVQPYSGEVGMLWQVWYSEVTITSIKTVQRRRRWRPHSLN
jgi:hypothetical protein